MVRRSKYSLFFAAAGLLFFNAAANGQPAPADATCQAALPSLTGEWNAIGFTPPSKPGQAVVSGKSGHTLTGGQFSYIENQIRLAHLDCARGSIESSMRRALAVREVIDGSARRTE